EADLETQVAGGRCVAAWGLFSVVGRGGGALAAAMLLLGASLGFWGWDWGFRMGKLANGCTILVPDM
ncbi:MAG TPA: hypothetical protein VGE07_19645, partial [Herpetosiphonaceae bacterium]